MDKVEFNKEKNEILETLTNLISKYPNLTLVDKEILKLILDFLRDLHLHYEKIFSKFPDPILNNGNLNENNLNKFTQKNKNLTEIIKNLEKINEGQIKILAYLLQLDSNKRATLEEISKAVNLHKTTTSSFLAKCRKLGIIDTIRRKRIAYYKIQPEFREVIEALLNKKS